MADNSLRAAKAAVQRLRTEEGPPWVREVAEDLAPYIAQTEDGYRVADALSAVADRLGTIETRLTVQEVGRSATLEVARRWSTPAMLLLMIIAQMLGLDTDALSSLMPEPAAHAAPLTSP